MLAEAVAELLSGDVGVSKVILREYINTTITFKKLSKLIETKPKNIMRVLSPSVNSRSKSLFVIFHAIHKLNNINFKIAVR